MYRVATSCVIMEATISAVCGYKLLLFDKYLKRVDSGSFPLLLNGRSLANKLNITYLYRNPYVRYFYRNNNPEPHT